MRFLSILAFSLVTSCAPQPPALIDYSLDELAALPEDELAQVDIALLNLKCAENLPGSGDVNLTTAQQTLDRWAEYVNIETERSLNLYHQDPAKFRHLEGYFRMQMLVTVVFL